MSANCYNRRGNVEEIKEQHQRLSTKHIETLKVLSDMSKEKDKLVTEVKELKEELLKCGELHTIANDAKARIKRVQEDCNRRLDHNNKTLTEKHQHEIMRVVSEKLEGENTWLEEKHQFENRICQLETVNAKLIEKLKLLDQNDTRFEVLNQQMEKAIEEVVKFKKDNIRLQENNTANTNKCQILEADLENLRPLEKQASELSLDLQEAKQKVRELSLQLKNKESILSCPPEPYNYEDHAELVKLKKEVVRLTKQVEGAENEMLVHRENAVSYKEQLLDKTNTLLDLRNANANLSVLLREVEDELEKLKKKLKIQSSNSASKEEVTFKEFVLLKRELSLIKEENLKLKQGRKGTKSLPSLKGSTGSTTSIWSHGSRGDASSANEAYKPKSTQHYLKKH
ncbi:uncharacterized protein [Antedon mediterranea]|uniref:uncharacterized protein n=1 Tax=Antedon mediterranea TaxID=105859 RepID=UPI003AF5E364